LNLHFPGLRVSALAACIFLSAGYLLIGQDRVDYDRQIHPILAARCLGCHSAEKRSGGLSLAAYQDALDGGRSGAVIRPGKSAASLLVQHIAGEVQPQMPLGGDPLSASEIATIRRWIDEGARRNPSAPPAQPKWEPSLTLEKPTAPGSPWKHWTSPLDRFTASYLAKHGAAEPKLVSDAQFARRAWLDVQGLLPTPEEMHAFLADQDSNKRVKLVDRLLSDNRAYADNWISWWNDLLRNDEGVAYFSETASRKSITPWLYAALESNMPYNRFVASLLDPASPSDPDGFLIGVNWRGTVSASQTPALQAAQNTAQIFLGINLKCNSCHDSFISKWKLKDAYSLASYFSAEEKLQLYRCDVAQRQFASAGFLYPELDRPLPSGSVADRRTTIAAIFTDPRNGRLPRTVVNRIWTRMMGRGFVADVDDMDGEPWSSELLDWLASDFVESGYNLKHLIATIASSNTYQLAAVPGEATPPKNYAFRGPEVRRMTAEEFADAVASITGDWHVAEPRAAVSSAQKPTIISGAPSDGASIRPRNISVLAAPARTPPANASSATIPPGEYSREWRVAASAMTRALGRPIRDQVYSSRDEAATTIQAVELMNGETLTHWLARGSKRMLGELPEDPKSLLARAVNGGNRSTSPTPFDVDISHSDKLYLIVRDALSTAPDKATPVWAQAKLVGPKGSTPLSSLKPVNGAGLRDGAGPIHLAGFDAPAADGIRVKLGSVLEYDIAGKSYTRFRAVPGLENVALAQGETVLSRFFVFDRQPDLDRLVPPYPETPRPREPVLTTIPAAVDRVFQYALGREPSSSERQIAEAAVADPAHPGKPSASGLADLLWAVLMKPEFQLIY
jgi:hypothetical protein